MTHPPPLPARDRASATVDAVDRYTRELLRRLDADGADFAELEVDTGLAATYLSDVLAGRQLVSLDECLRLARACGMTIGEYIAEAREWAAVNTRRRTAGVA